MLRIETLELLDIFFTSNFERSCNLDAKTTKKLLRQKRKRQDTQFPRFPSFRFCPIPKMKNLEISENILSPQTLTVVVI